MLDVFYWLFEKISHEIWKILSCALGLMRSTQKVVKIQQYIHIDFYLVLLYFYLFYFTLKSFKRASNLFMFQNLKFFGFRIWPHCEWSLFGGNQWARTRFTYAYTCLVQIIYLVWFIGLLMNVNLFIMEIQSRMRVKDGLKPNITILTKGFVALQFIV